MWLPYSRSKCCLAVRIFAIAALFPAPGALAASTTVTSLTLSLAGKTASQAASGSVVTLTATVTAAGQPVPLGQVEFCDASAPLCSDVHLLDKVALNQAGSASTSLRPGIGSHTWKAVFLSSAGHAASESTQAKLTVNGSLFAPTVTTLSSTGLQGNHSLQAQVRAYGVHPAPPGGSISLRDLTASLAGASTAVLGSALPGTELLTAPQIPSFDGAYAVVTADLNRDGLMDLAWTEEQSAQLQAALGKGDGTFTLIDNQPSTGYQPATLRVADFNGDGIPDLLSLNSDSINVLLGTGGEKGTA